MVSCFVSSGFDEGATDGCSDESSKKFLQYCNTFPKAPDRPVLDFSAGHKLVHIVLGYSALSKQGIALASAIPSLESLHLRCGLRKNDLNDDCLTEVVVHSNLCSLVLVAPFENMTSNGWNAVSRIDSLKELQVNYVSLSDEGIAVLSGLPHLRRLQLWNCRGAVDQTIEGLRGLKQIDDLALDLPNHIRNVDAIGSLSQLTVLRIRGADFSQPEWKSLNSLTMLKRFRIENCKGLDGNNANMPFLPSLEEIELNRTPVGCKALEVMLRSRYLRRIIIIDTSLSEDLTRDVSERGNIEILRPLSCK